MKWFLCFCLTLSASTTVHAHSWTLWFWNGTSSDLTLSTAHTKCFANVGPVDVSPGALAVLHPDSSDSQCRLSQEDAWIELQVSQKSPAAKVSRIKLTERHFHNSAFDNGWLCSVELLHNSNAYVEGTGHYRCTTDFSVTIEQNILAAGTENLVRTGLFQLNQPVGPYLDEGRCVNVSWDRANLILKANCFGWVQGQVVQATLHYGAVCGGSDIVNVSNGFLSCAGTSEKSYASLLTRCNDVKVSAGQVTGTCAKADKWPYIEFMGDQAVLNADQVCASGWRQNKLTADDGLITCPGAFKDALKSCNNMELVKVGGETSGGATTVVITEAAARCTTPGNDFCTSINTALCANLNYQSANGILACGSNTGWIFFGSGSCGSLLKKIWNQAPPSVPFHPYTKRRGSGGE